MKYHWVNQEINGIRYIRFYDELSRLACMILVKDGKYTKVRYYKDSVMISRG